MREDWDLLIVSNRLENKKVLLEILAKLPVDVFTAATIEQAKEALSIHPIRMIFSEERVSDGTYKDLLPAVPDFIHVVVMLSTGEWEECIEAMKLGVREVIRCPLQPTDVELALIHARREQVRETELSMAQTSATGPDE